MIRYRAEDSKVQKSFVSGTLTYKYFITHKCSYKDTYANNLKL